MEITVRKYQKKDLPRMIQIWNEVVEEGIAFPQEDFLDAQTGKEFFGQQTYNGVAEERGTGDIYGLYILHPNNVGRCGHIANASFVVSRGPMDFRCCSLTRWWPPTSTRGISTNAWASSSWARFRGDFG